MNSTENVLQRRLGRVVTLPPAKPGQFGPAHTVVEVLGGESYGDTEGLEGAGAGRARILQLWLTLPRASRWAPPGFQDQAYADLPVRREPGAEVRVYSGSSGGVRSPTLNHVPVTLVELLLSPGASVDQELPASFNGFLYVLDGEVTVGSGTDATPLRPGQVGWLDRPAARGESVLRITGAGPGQQRSQRSRVLLYAGEPQGDPLVSYGPFIGDTQADIVRVMGEYRAGRYGPPPPRVP